MTLWLTTRWAADGDGDDVSYHPDLLGLAAAFVVGAESGGEVLVRVVCDDVTGQLLRQWLTVHDTPEALQAEALRLGAAATWDASDYRVGGA